MSCAKYVNRCKRLNNRISCWDKIFFSINKNGSHCIQNITGERVKRFTRECKPCKVDEMQCDILLYFKVAEF